MTTWRRSSVSSRSTSCTMPWPRASITPPSLLNPNWTRRSRPPPFSDQFNGFRLSNCASSAEGRRLMANHAEIQHQLAPTLHWVGSLIVFLFFSQKFRHLIGRRRGTEETGCYRLFCASLHHNKYCSGTVDPDQRGQKQSSGTQHLDGTVQWIFEAETRGVQPGTLLSREEEEEEEDGDISLCISFNVSGER